MEGEGIIRDWTGFPQPVQSIDFIRDWTGFLQPVQSMAPLRDRAIASTDKLDMTSCARRVKQRVHHIQHVIRHLAAGAMREGIPLITNDRKFGNVLRAIDYPVEGF